MKKLISAIVALSLASASVPAFAVTHNNTLTRSYEALDRGLVAVNTGNGIFLSWRLYENEDRIFGTATENVSFSLYRGSQKIATLDDTTNYLDTQGSSSSVYSVAPIIGGVEQAACEAVSVMANNYIDIPLDVPADVTLADGGTYSYSAGDTSVGDVDGDGVYEYFVKWNCNPQDNSNGGYTGNVLIDAYKLDGEKLWRVDLGPNIRSGEHYTQFLVYDFDGDGKAEMTVKTAPGSVDANGDYVTDASTNSKILATDNTVELVDEGGRINTGDEFFTVFDGETGAAIDTIYYPNQRIDVSVWGDNYGNRADRYIATVAYLDGERPAAVYWRGYYGAQSGYGTRTAISGITFDGERLSVDYCIDSYDTEAVTGYLGTHGYNSSFATYLAQGNHNITTADVDGDGKDEIISGALCLEVNDKDVLAVKWCSFEGHGDALHIGDYDPTHDGYEYFRVLEGSPYGMSLLDAATGEILYHLDAGSDTGRGIMLNLGIEGYATLVANDTISVMGNGVYKETPNNISNKNFRIYWNGDLYEELLDGTTITTWNGSAFSNIFSASGCTSINGTKSVPAVTADLFGDWREEAAYPLSDSSALRIFTTTYSSDYKIKTLMHDSVYRSGVAAEQTAYNQPPHIGFYLAEEAFMGELQDISITSLPTKRTFNVGDEIDYDGLAVVAHYTHGDVNVTGYSITEIDSYDAGSHTVTVSYMGYEEEFEVTVDTPFVINSDGYITGYKNSDNTAPIIPNTINSTSVVGFAAGSMLNANASELYIRDAEMYFADAEIFSDNIVITCFEYSTAHIHCDTYGVNYELIIEESEEKGINYETDFYSSYYSGTTMLAQGSSALTLTDTDNNATYKMPAEDSRWSQFMGGSAGSLNLVTDSDNHYLEVLTAPYASMRSYAYSPSLTFNDTYNLTEISKLTFSMDVKFTGSQYALLYDDANLIDTVSVSALGLSAGAWYNYQLIYENESYTRIILDANGNKISETQLSETPGATSISRIVFSQDFNWGSTSSNQVGYYDNFEFSAPPVCAVSATVVNEDGMPVEKAAITIGDRTYTTDVKGKANISLEKGSYDVTVTANGYNDYTTQIRAIGETAALDVTLKYETYEATAILLSKTKMVLRVGDMDIINASVKPANADQNPSYQSNDESVATVDENGVVKGVAVGKATISVTKDSITETCAVTVIEGGYEQTLTSVALIGTTTLVTNRWVESTDGIYSGEAYDQNGVKIYDAEVTVEYPTGPFSGTIYGDTMTVSAKSGSTQGRLTVKSGSLSKKTTVRFSYPDDNYEQQSAAEFSESSYSGFALLQTNSELTSTDSGSGITYTVTPRTSGGDGYTGFVVSYDDTGDYFMRIQAGRFSTSSRNGYFVLNDAPEIISGKDYCFSADICFEENDDDMIVTISDGTNTVSTLSAELLGLTEGKWYTYEIRISDDIWTEVITDVETGEAVSTKEITTTASRIYKFDCVKTTTEATNASMLIDDISLCSADDIFTTASVVVTEADGTPVEGALVTINNTTVESDENGIANIDCYAGPNYVTITSEGKSTSKIVEITYAGQRVGIKFADNVITPLGNGFWYGNIQGCVPVEAERILRDSENEVEAASVYVHSGKSVFGKPIGEGEKLMLWDSIDTMLPLAEAMEK